MREALRHQGGAEGREVQEVDGCDRKNIKLKERRTMIEERKAALEEKKAVLEKKRVKIAANAEDAKMLTLNVDSLDVDARMIMHAIRFKCCSGRRMSWRGQSRSRSRMTTNHKKTNRR